MGTLRDNLVAKSGKYKYHCVSCDYECSKKYNWEKHLLTAKHIECHKGDILVAKSGNLLKTEIFICEFCNKEYQHRQGLWRHKRDKCCKEISNDSSQTQNDKLIEYLMRENKEMKELILEIVKNGSTTNNTIHNTTNNNSHNKAFNLNFFLNETCKNAMNITDFVESIKLQLNDFINVGQVGFIEGISNIIVKKLNDLDETIRPIHCTDQKRETFYVKDENQWEKEEEDKKKLIKMIKSVAYKNEKLMKTYKEKYPDYNDSESTRSDQYSKMVIEAMDCKEESQEKIIKNISKATVIKRKC